MRISANFLLFALSRSNLGNNKVKKTNMHGTTRSSLRKLSWPDLCGHFTGSFFTQVPPYAARTWMVHHGRSRAARHMPKPRPTPKTKTKTKTTAMAGDGETTKGTSSLREASCPPPSSRARSRVVAERHRRPTTAGATPPQDGRDRGGSAHPLGGRRDGACPSAEGQLAPLGAGSMRARPRTAGARGSTRAAREDGPRGRGGVHARARRGKARGMGRAHGPEEDGSEDERAHGARWARGGVRAWG